MWLTLAFIRRHVILVMATINQHDFKELTFGEVTVLDKELGRGSYGKVYAVKYRGTLCAAKEIDSILIDSVSQPERRGFIESFLRECRLWSKLRHPNIVQFIGVYYPGGAFSSSSNNVRIPVMVMEMMVDSLISFVKKHEKIPVHIKYSIVHDVSHGLCYLHNHDPPIVHRDLSPNNVLLTTHHVAKISDQGVAKVIEDESRNNRGKLTKAPGMVDFMPPECLTDHPVYDTPVNVFSFAGIILYTFNQWWPNPSSLVQCDARNRPIKFLTEIERRQQHLDKMIGEAEVLRPLVEQCLFNDPRIRPTAVIICERIQVAKDAYLRRCPQDVIILHQQFEQLNLEYAQQQKLIEQKTQNPNTDLERLRKVQKQKVTELEQQLDLIQVMIKFKF